MVLIPHKSLNMVRNSQNVTVNIGTYCESLGTRTLQSTILTNVWIFPSSKIPVWWSLQVHTYSPELSCFMWDGCRSPLLSDQTYQTPSPSQAPTQERGSATRDSACAWAPGEGRALSYTMISREMVIVMFTARVSTAQTFRALQCHFTKQPPTSRTSVRRISWIHAGGTAVTFCCDEPGAVEVFN